MGKGIIGFIKFLSQAFGILMFIALIIGFWILGIIFVGFCSKIEFFYCVPLSFLGYIILASFLIWWGRN